VTVDPTDPTRFVAAWQQDRWANGGAHGLVVATSVDAGASWARDEPPFSACAAPTATVPSRVSDPWLAFGPDGTAYLTGLAVTQPNVTWVTVSRSTDGGATWSTPEPVAKSDTKDHFNDKESVTADPARPAHAYIVWDQGAGGESESNEQGRGQGRVMLAETTDGGASWSPPRTIGTFDGTPVGNVIAVLPDGTLIDLFVLAPRSDGSPAREIAIRSTDGGATWSDGVTIATLDAHAVIGSQPPGIRGGGGLPDVGLDPRTGTLHAVWTDVAGDVPRIRLSSSADGLAWTDPVTLPRPASSPVFMPSVEIAPSGVIAVEYTDLRAADAGHPFLADRFLATSADGGLTWRERRLTSTFDMASAPDAGGRFLGDYSGLAVAGTSFVSAFAVTTGDATDPTQLVVRVDPIDDPAATVVR
jgi:hypothetical protein